jgi:hypothetical protein
MKLVSYHRTGNLGDAIQTVALERWLRSRGENIQGHLPRQGLEDGMMINGWHRHSYEPLPARALFLGIHTDRAHLQVVGKQCKIGARDPWTLREARALGLSAELTGCVTSTLQRTTDETATKLKLRIDCRDGGNTHTQEIPEEMTWPEQLRAAQARLDLFARATHVTTTRLHVALPCIAMGVPVVLEDWSPTYQPERFSLLAQMIQPGQLVQPGDGISDSMRERYEDHAPQCL